MPRPSQRTAASAHPPRRTARRPSDCFGAEMVFFFQVSSPGPPVPLGPNKNVWWGGGAVECSPALSAGVADSSLGPNCIQSSRMTFALCCMEGVNTRCPPSPALQPREKNFWGPPTLQPIQTSQVYSRNKLPAGSSRFIYAGCMCGQQVSRGSGENTGS